MALESDFFFVSLEMKKYHINMLKQLKHNGLVNKITSILIFVSVFSTLFLPSCTKETISEFPAMSISDFTGTIWRLQSVSTIDTSTPVPQQMLLDRNWLRFYPDGSMEGFGENYAILGRYSLSGDRISFSLVKPDSARLDHDIFCTYLLSVKYLATPEGGLKLSTPKNNVMNFVAVKDSIWKNSWRWVETRSGIDEMGGTPQSAGFEVVVDFSDTAFVFYKNEQEVARGRYMLQNTRLSDCLGENSSMVRAIIVDEELTSWISISTNALVTIPSPSIVSYEITPDGRIILSLRENSCAGSLYIFEKM